MAVYNDQVITRFDMLLGNVSGLETIVNNLTRIDKAITKSYRGMGKFIGGLDDVTPASRAAFININKITDALDKQIVQMKLVN
jgi:hypothetical protein